MGWVGQLGWGEMGWDAMGWDGGRWGRLSWNGMAWHGMRWDGLSWNGMGWELKGYVEVGFFGFRTALGRDGMGCDRLMHPPSALPLAGRATCACMSLWASILRPWCAYKVISPALTGFLESLGKDVLAAQL